MAHDVGRQRHAVRQHARRPDDADGEAHRLGRVAFALNPARHFSLKPGAGYELPATTPWAEAPPLRIHPRLREYGEAAPRGPLPKVRERSAERALLAREAPGARVRVLSNLAEMDLHAVEVSQIPMDEENTAALERGVKELGIIVERGSRL